MTSGARDRCTMACAGTVTVPGILGYERAYRKSVLWGISMARLCREMEQAARPEPGAPGIQIY